MKTQHTTETTTEHTRAVVALLERIIADPTVRGASRELARDARGMLLSAKAAKPGNEYAEAVAAADAFDLWNADAVESALNR